MQQLSRCGVDHHAHDVAKGDLLIVAGDVAADCLENGLIVNAVNASTIRLAPPLTVTVDEIEEATGILAAAIANQVPGGAGHE